MSWNDIGSESTGGDKKVFTKFPEGVTIIRILDEVPHTRWQHWMPEPKRSVTCPGKGCPICEINKAAKANGEDRPYSVGKKHSFNIINRTTNGVEVMEQSNTFFEDLRIMREDDGDVRDYDIKVRRTGSGTNTKYRLTVGDKGPITDAEKELATTNLAEYFSAPTNEQITRLIAGEDPKEVFKSEDIDLA